MTAGELLAYCKKSVARRLLLRHLHRKFCRRRFPMQTDMQALCLPPTISDAQMGAFRQRFMAETMNGIFNRPASTVQDYASFIRTRLGAAGHFPCPSGSSEHSAEPPSLNIWVLPRTSPPRMRSNGSALPKSSAGGTDCMIETGSDAGNVFSSAYFTRTRQ